jgi:hypothetical protein
MAVADSHKPHLPDFVPLSLCHTEEHEALRHIVRRKASAAGLLQLGCLEMARQIGL